MFLSIGQLDSLIRSDAHEEGYRAYLSKVTYTSCPYDCSTQNWLDWWDGYFDHEEFMIVAPIPVG